MVRSRRLGAGLLGAALALGGVVCAGTAGLATAASPAAAAAAGWPAQVAVIPADAPGAAVDDAVVVAGTTGFLHQYKNSAPYLWTDDGTGVTTVVPGLAGLNQGYITFAGGDTIGVSVQVPARPRPGDVSFLDLPTMTWRQDKVPPNDRVLGLFGTSVLGTSVLVNSVSGSVVTPEVLKFTSETSYTSTAVTGLLAGAARLGSSRTGDAASAVVQYTRTGYGTDSFYGLLDLATGVVAPIPDPALDYQRSILTASNVALYDSATGDVRVYSRSDVTAAPQVVTLPPLASGAYQIALAGDHVVGNTIVVACTFCDYATAPAFDVPLSGGPAGTAVAQAQTEIYGVTQAPDGSALVVGGTGAADWAVRRLDVNGGDQLTDNAVLPLTGPVSNGGLTISQGLVRHVEVQATPPGPVNYLMFNHELDADTSGYAWPGVNLDGGVLASPLPCTAGAQCIRTVDSDWYGTSYLTPDPYGFIDLREQWEAGASTMSLRLPSAGGTLIDSSPDFAIVDGTGPAAQYVVDVGHESIVKTRAITGAALWYSTLWSSAGPGMLQATNLDTKVVSQPIATGWPCVASEIQATLRWLYWSCGAGGPAGVYDLRTKAEIAVPAGPMLLGDGYLVSGDATTGELKLYDVHGDHLAGPQDLASVPAGPAADGRDITWAVDKYSGDVAYVAADDSVHVIDTGGLATAPVIADPPAAWLADTGLVSFTKNGGWFQGLSLSRPVTSWTLTIQLGGTAQIVHTMTGGPARRGFYVSWDGRLPDGKKAYSGPYSFSLSVLPVGSSTPVSVPGGRLTVLCGRIPFRSMDCDGEPALLAVGSFDPHYSRWSGYWYQGTPDGKLVTGGPTDYWPLCSAGAGGSTCVADIVPFGDFTGDGFADLLVKYRNGILRAYRGIGQAWFGQGTKSILIGRDWNQYGLLAAPGDLTGSGRPDLVARDRQGRLWLYAATGHGTFDPRRLIGGGWNQYVRLVGAGDLTSSGSGDLLAVDRGGVMWLFAGNGHGGLHSPVRVSGGWAGYNAIIGIGDLNHDGQGDLVARDASGHLWFFAGNGAGGFARRVLLASRWQRFQGIF